MTHTVLLITTINLNELAIGLWKGKEPLFFCYDFRMKLDKKTFQTQIMSLKRLLFTV